MSLVPAGQAPGAWECILADDFTGPMTPVGDPAAGYYRLSEGGPVWRCWYPDWANNSMASLGGAHANNGTAALVYYDPTGVSVADSVLRLTARHEETFPGLPFTSGMVQSNPGFTLTFGYAEARIRLPSAYQSWPAFWCAGAGDYTVNSDEFDTIEAWGDNPDGSDPGYYTVTCWRNGTGGQGGDVYDRHVPCTITDWHTYGVAWAPDGLRFYLDGALVVSDTNPADIPTRAMYVLLNLSVRTGADPAQYPATMEVDWVRWYKATTAPALRVGDAAVSAVYLGGTPVSPSLLTP